MLTITSDLFKIIDTTLQSISAKYIFQNRIKISNSTFECNYFKINLNQFENVYVIGFGKASSSLATELEKYILDKIKDGLVITKYGFKTPTEKIQIYEAGHPIPDENTIKYSQEIIEVLEKRTPNDLIICLISGGGSSLFEILDPNFDLTNLKTLNEILLKEQIPIFEINRIRKAFSKVKDGKLLRHIYPSTCLSLIISDVVGNDLSVIASGPTFINDNLSYTEIININHLKELLTENFSINEIYNFIDEKIFEQEIINYFKEKVHNLIIASNKDAVNASINIMKDLGYDVYLIEYNLLSTTDKVCDRIISEMKELNVQNCKFKKAFIFGGETYLKVTGTGKGGRNIHLILKVLNEIISKNYRFEYNYLVASIATDGNDGATDCAGAFITNEIVEQLKEQRMKIEHSLTNFDSYNLFNEYNHLIRTGNTFTNVADLIIGLFEK